MSISTNNNITQRNPLVDIIRGFALAGVLFANFMGYLDQQMPEEILLLFSNSLDLSLIKFNKVFLEWKFMTLFSILFGYGFGLILESLERKGISAAPFFIRRMGWLFLMGCIHSLFWWGDVLHLYAISGLLLFLFRKCATRLLLVAGISCAIFLPLFVRFLFRNHPETFTDSDMAELYSTLKNGTMTEVIKFNIEFYYRMFFVSGNDMHDVIQTLGRFLLGYYLLRIRLFDDVVNKSALFFRVFYGSLPVALLYFICRLFSLEKMISDNPYVISFLLSIGILSTTIFYVASLLLLYIKFSRVPLFEYLRSIGRMTLTNYLFISVFMVLLLYGFGFGQLGLLPIHIIWCIAGGFLVFECIFSFHWLKKFRYGPFEWIWRVMSFGKWVTLKK